MIIHDQEEVVDVFMVVEVVEMEEIQKELHKTKNISRDNIKDIRFYPHSLGRQQTVTFSPVRDKIIGIIQRNYDYGVHLAKELRNEKEFEILTFLAGKC